MEKPDNVLHLMRHYSSIILSTIRVGEVLSISKKEYACAQDAIHIFLILFDDPDKDQREMMREKLLKKLKQVAEKKKSTRNLWDIPRIEKCLSLCMREKENPRDARVNGARQTRIHSTKKETEKESVGYFHD